MGERCWRVLVQLRRPIKRENKCLAEPAEALTRDAKLEVNLWFIVGALTRSGRSGGGRLNPRFASKFHKKNSYNRPISVVSQIYMGIGKGENNVVSLLGIYARRSQISYTGRKYVCNLS